MTRKKSANYRNASSNSSSMRKDMSEENEIRKCQENTTINNTYPSIKCRKDALSYRWEIRERQTQLEWFKVAAGYLLSNVGLFALTVLYAIIGAHIYIGMELPREEDDFSLKRERARTIDASMNYIAERSWYLLRHTDPPVSKESFENETEKELIKMASFIVKSIEDVQYDGNINTWDYDWSFQKALLFTITIMTTIGYGHISPKTVLGQIFTIFYSVVGIGLLLVFLGAFGNHMANVLKYGYSRVLCRWFRARRKESEVPKTVTRTLLRARLIDENVGDESYMPTNTIGIPIIVSVFVITCYLGIGTVLFSLWEGWDMMSATYFSFITATSIGFGDLVPLKAFSDTKSIEGQIKVIITSAYCIAGLALVSMCLSLIQENVSLYSSYFTQTEKEDTELDIIVPCKRIPNWIKSIEFLSDESNDTKSNDEDSDISFPSRSDTGTGENDADSIASDIYEDEQGLGETSSSSDEGESSTEGSGEEEHNESDTDKYSDTEDDDGDGSVKGRYSDF